MPADTLLLPLPETIAATVRSMALRILRPEDTYQGEGLELSPHVTLLYGVETDDLATIVDVVPTAALQATIRGIDIFSPEDAAYDVVVHRLDSPDLLVVHAMLAACLGAIPSPYSYTPHITLGYVRRGMGAQYADLVTGLEGTVIDFSCSEFRRQDAIVLTIPLQFPTLTAEEQNFQTRDGKRFHREDFFYTPSADPSTWKLLRTGTPGSEPDTAHVGAAVAALGKGYRGETVDIPAADRPGVIRKVRAAWKALHPEATPEDVPEVLQSMAAFAVTLDAMALDVPALDGHPNRLPFRGILTRVDVPSDSAPGGANGHRVFLSSAVAEAALPSLLGMGVGVHTSLKRHDAQRKIGVITEAYVADGALHVAGFLYARDFPQEVASIQYLARRGLLGMSFEVANVEIDDTQADVWTILSCIFTGAAILERAHAAYKTTTLAAAQERTAMAEDHEEHEAHEAQEDLALSANMDTLMETMTRMSGNYQHYQACMDAMDKLLGMRAGLDSLTEALEHLVKMHEALHDMGEQGEAMAADMTETVSASTVQAETTERLTQVESQLTALAASIALLTDGQAEIRTLLTDRTAGRPATKGLATDGPPQRRTMAATGEYPTYLSKYGLESEQQYKESDIDALLRNAGITDPMQRLAVKLEMQKQGQMVL